MSRVGQRRAWAELAAAWAERGLNRSEIGRALGISRAYASELITDPSGTKTRERKNSYRGVCKSCGGPTDGSNGRRKAPRVCARCLAAQQRQSTRDHIISVIQGFAEIHGRPPLAMEFGRRLREPNVALNSVQTAFDSWGDAIVAAGFERPKRGRKVLKRGGGVNGLARTYVVLRKNGDGKATECARVEAYAPEHAVEQIATEPGVYVAVLDTYWIETEVAPVSKLAATRVGK